MQKKKEVNFTLNQVLNIIDLSIFLILILNYQLQNLQYDFSFIRFIDIILNINKGNKEKFLKIKSNR